MDSPRLIENTVEKRLPWHKPVLQRLSVSVDTKFGGLSPADGDGFGVVIVDLGEG